jgi:U3 small nucleolar ribonucleoprotein component
MDGELLLFQPRSDDQEDSQSIVYRDYSLRKRMKPNKNEKKSAFQKQQALVDESEKTKLQCLDIDIESPLSRIDWQVWGNIIEQTKGFGWC